MFVREHFLNKADSILQFLPRGIVAFADGKGSNWGCSHEVSLREARDPESGPDRIGLAKKQPTAVKYNGVCVE